MTPDVEYRAAVAADAPAIRALLSVAGLPSEDADPARQEFLVASRAGELVGCAAVEVRRRDALLRSVAVTPAARRQGLGDALVARILDHARALGVSTVWILTTTADPWFGRRGFAPVDRAAAPPAIAATSEFRSTCPAEARCMVRALDV
jgi:amino-acid N-acetyltransferase